MTKDEAREILIRHNAWRRGEEGGYTPEEVRLVGQAIDCAIQALGDGWVSVGDRLPLESDTDKNGHLFAWDRIANKCQIVDIRAVFDMKIRFRYYQPLPSPPKPKQP